MLIDKPAPGTSYVLLYLGLIVFLVALPLFLRHFRKLRGLLAGLVFIICLGGAAVFAMFLFSGFTTQYSLDNGTLYLRSGFLHSTQVDLGAITEVEKVPTNWHSLGWALNTTGYSNRFYDCLKLKTDQGDIFISPRDPVQFAQEIKSRQRRSSLLRKNLIFR
jgi:hypothetical protein